MSTRLNHFFVIGLILAGSAMSAWAKGKTAGVPKIARNPYIGAIAVDAATGKALAEDNADAAVYPASVIKLMNLFVVMDHVSQGSVHLTDPVEVTAEVSHMGGSRVFLKEHEVFSVEDLVYALMVQSANDAALALAEHVGGSQQAFVDLMNQKAQALGMTHTRFYSCHGEPPTPPRKLNEVDVSTPRDLAILGRALIAAHPEVLRYTSTKARVFRQTPLFNMDNHNHLLGHVPGVDGLKTGWFRSAGYSIVVSAERNGRRVIVVVAGSDGSLGKIRDQAATEFLAKAFTAVQSTPPVVVAAPRPSAPANTVASAPTAQHTPAAVAQPSPTPPAQEPKPEHHSNWHVILVIAIILVAGIVAVAGFLAWRQRKKDEGLFSVAGDSNKPRLVNPPLRR